MEVYADPITVNCRKVLAGLQLMGVDYNLNKVDYFQSEQKGPSYVAINPNAALPAMRDDGLTLWESNAILRYYARQFPESGLYLSHPAAKYFSVGKIGRDQVQDYSVRKGMPMDDVERWLSPNLAYL